MEKIIVLHYLFSSTEPTSESGEIFLTSGIANSNTGVIGCPLALLKGEIARFQKCIFPRGVYRPDEGVNPVFASRNSRKVVYLGRVDWSGINEMQSNKTIAKQYLEM